MGIEMLTLKNLVLLAGVLHFCQLPAMFMAPKMLGWREDLGKLQPINRRIFNVMAGGIMMTVLGLGLVVALAPAEVAGGSRLGTALAAFLGVFWAWRGSVQVFLYSKIWPGGWLGRASHWGLSALFAFLSAVYLAAFVAGVRG